ncbi:MAG: DNA-directed RNA polymerase subunit beta [Candidatus Eisenbacteria bacterium]|uniref:DNA-directed RNA polymerase subunit beta n=1 Tax=Eiseniibacteriota bacterium TaxID=2212470 RepID=A0A849SEK6_UNCEI|nr:DNA-directed RNA polymerase subunit beta [Candidatus Eisenbacteria bacterium]
MKTVRRKERKSFSKIDREWNLQIPNLLEVQLKSFRDFLQMDLDPLRRRNEGLQEVFTGVFPISDPRELFALDFVGYEIGEPKYTVTECIERDLSFSAPLKARMRLMTREEVDGVKRDKDVIEQEVYLGELPLITDSGTFIINGAERVIVSQLHRSPGVFFDELTHPNGKLLFSARIIPYRGSWVEFSLDVNDIMHVHIDRKRKLPVTVLLRALGFVGDREILDLFYEREAVDVKGKKAEAALGRICAQDLADDATGEILLEANDELTAEKIEVIKRAGLETLEVYLIPKQDEADLIRNTLRKDPTRSQEDALHRIYNLLRPGEPPRADSAREILNKLFFNPKRYDLARVGRYKLNQKLPHEYLLPNREVRKRLGLGIPDLNHTTLCREDFIVIVKYLVMLRTGGELVTDRGSDQAVTDDIDHLGNRRVRSVGELLANQFNIGLARMARIIRERMSLQDQENVTPMDLVNSRTISAVIQSFFGSSQLSQFMDQTNPLAELTNKRRLSALGPGGLTRDRAGFEVRDVHYTHYGRVCPIETPEGPNIGLISSLSTYARVNEFGFLETPYFRVNDGIVDRKKPEFLAADIEDRAHIAPANTPFDVRSGTIDPEMLTVRHRGEYPTIDRRVVEYMDVSPIQLVSPAAALIPFLEHDDANRALMGSNMQRQAVPLLQTEAPLVGTGLEEKVAVDSGALVLSRRSGVVEFVSGEMIAVRYERDEDEPPVDYSEQPNLDIYRLVKFRRSNQDTCLNQRPVVAEGQKVKKGQVIADGPATRDGELALGRNCLVAFMPWGGYNFEDAILVSEKLIKEDMFTSIHIEEFELQVRDTKRGVEEITREIPNVSEDAVKNLDEEGVIRIGARVRQGDILVGKVTPKGEQELSPEERLLKAIFGDKAGDVRDASLKAPPGMDGIVIDIKVFSRREKDEGTKQQEKKKIDKLRRESKKERERVADVRLATVSQVLDEQLVNVLRSASSGEPIARKGRKYSSDFLVEVDLDDLAWGTPVTDEARINERFWAVMDGAQSAFSRCEKELEKEIEKVTRGDELPPGVVKLVKVYIAKKRKLSVGDKMAGRHGNKGVVAKILPEEDLPYLPEGSPVEIVLNPLGVPSRMNIGQVLETHLGWAAHSLGYNCATPVFAGASVDEIKAELKTAGLPEDGKSVLHDGRSGESFDQRVCVGYLYMLKLSHLVDDKIHARSTGPYSLVTQQPLGGKAQFGGQRFGEMEVWALEAYGAAYTLQELLTVKSDDVAGRSRIYEAIVKGENPPEPGTPESFNVLVKELQSLCLEVQFEEV